MQNLSTIWTPLNGRSFSLPGWLSPSRLGPRASVSLAAAVLATVGLGAAPQASAQTLNYEHSSPNGYEANDVETCTVTFTGGPVPASVGTYTVYPLAGGSFSITVDATGKATPSTYSTQIGGYAAVQAMKNGATGITFGITGYDTPHGDHVNAPESFLCTGNEIAYGVPQNYSESLNCVLQQASLAPTPSPTPGAGTSSTPPPPATPTPAPDIGGQGTAGGGAGGGNTTQSSPGPAATPGSDGAAPAGSNSNANSANLAKIANSTTQPSTSYSPDGGNPGTFSGATGGGDWSWADGKTLANNMQAAPGRIQTSLNPLYDAGSGFAAASSASIQPITSITLPLNWHVGNQTVASLTLDFTPYASWITIGRNLLLFGLTGTMIVMFARAPAKYL